MRSIQALDTKLTADERDGILRTLELAKANRKCGTEALQATLRDLESAAAIVGRAMLRT
jgi:hypothetical protein